MSRRAALGWMAGAAGTVGLERMHDSLTRPDLNDTHAVADFIDTHIDEVGDVHHGRLPLIIYSADLHVSALQGMHYKPIAKLSSAIDLSLLGIEGALQGELTREYVQKEWEAVQQKQEQGGGATSPEDDIFGWPSARTRVNRRISGNGPIVSIRLRAWRRESSRAREQVDDGRWGSVESDTWIDTSNL